MLSALGKADGMNADTTIGLITLIIDLIALLIAAYELGTKAKRK